MTGFDEMEESVFTKDKTVFLNENGFEGFGTVKLDRLNTVVDLISNQRVGTDVSEEGWFDLTLEFEGNSKLHLHNALDIEGRPRFFHEVGKYRQKIFPNTLVFNAEKLTKDLLVKRIGFNLEDGVNFFNYDHIEWQPVNGLKKTTMRLLNQLRTHNHKKYRSASKVKNYDFSDPREVYFHHTSGHSIKFKANDISYEIFTSDHTQQGGFGTSIKIKYNPGFNIKFPKAIPIDEAISNIYTWHKLFNQIAYRRLCLTNVYGSGNLDPNKGTAEFYFPNEPRVQLSENHRFGPRYSPFNQREEESELRNFMRNWLLKNEERHRFRTILDHLINTEHNANEITKIAMLCGGIETLTLADFRTPLPKDKAKSLSAKTLEASQKLGLPFDKARINGMISMLGKPGLRGFLEHLYQVAIDANLPNHKNDFIRQVLRLRNVAAHGHSNESLNQPIAYPVFEALKSLCIFYDLASSGLDLTNCSLLAKENFFWAINRMASLLGRK